MLGLELNGKTLNGKMLGLELSKKCLVRNYTVPTCSSQENKTKTFANEKELIFWNDLTHHFMFYKYGFNPKLR